MWLYFHLKTGFVSLRGAGSSLVIQRSRWKEAGFQESIREGVVFPYKQLLFTAPSETLPSTTEFPGNNSSIDIVDIAATLSDKSLSQFHVHLQHYKITIDTRSCGLSYKKLLQLCTPKVDTAGVTTPKLPVSGLIIFM